MPFILDLQSFEITEMVTEFPWMENASFNINGIFDIEGHINKAETFVIVKTRFIAFDIRQRVRRGGKCTK